MQIKILSQSLTLLVAKPKGTLYYVDDRLKTEK